MLVLGPMAAPVAALIVGGGILLLIGTVDDFRPLSHYLRFGAQIAAASVLCFWGNVILNDLGAIGPEWQTLALGDWAIPITIFATVGVINAVSISDGMDGLAGSLVLVALAGAAVVAGMAGRAPELQLILLLSAVLIGFLYFNMRLPWRSRARAFMGDAGSMFLGLTLACLLISLSQGENRAMPPVTALWFFAIPLIDTLSVMLRRLLHRRSPFTANREHYHHILVYAGFSVTKALLIIVGIAMALAGIGLLGLYLQVPESVMLYAFLGVFGLHFLILMRAWKFRRFLKRILERRGEVDRRVVRRDRRVTNAISQTIDWQGKEHRHNEDRRKLPDRRTGYYEPVGNVQRQGKSASQAEPDQNWGTLMRMDRRGRVPNKWWIVWLAEKAGWLSFVKENIVLSFLEFNADLSKKNFHSADFKGINLKRTNLKETNLGEANLERANLKETDLRWAHLEEANLKMADLRMADLRGAHLEGAYLKKADLRKANLKRANLKETHLEGANLRRAHLEGAYLEKAYLEGAYLEGAYLEEDELSIDEAELPKANLEKTNLRKTNLSKTALYKKS